MKTTHAILTLTLIFIYPLVAYAQNTTKKEVTDTIGTDLKEVIVEADAYRIVEDGVSYTPDKNVRKFAMDAVDLLSRMAIPQLIITPNNSVQTSAGQPVKIYIDYMEATPEDLSGMRPSDVKRVEVLEYPTDARFHQAEHVVNFIMQKYEWGGYTKLTASGGLLNNDYASGSLYSKFSYKKNWTFDVNANGAGRWSNHGQQDNQITFRDFNYGTQHYDAITKTSKTDKYKARSNTENAGFRAKYRRDGMTITHSAAFDRNAMPYSNRHSSAEFSNTLFPKSATILNENSQQSNAWAVGDYYFSLPADNSLSVDWIMGYQGSRSNSDYRLGNLTPILNGEKSSFYYPQFTISHTKKFNHNNSLGATIYSRNFLYSTTYTGSVDRKNDILTSTNQLLLSYRQRWNSGFGLMVRAGLSYLHMKENHVTHIRDWRPSIYLSMNYTLNKNNALSLSGSWYSAPELHNNTSDVITRDDELLWQQGNPNLKSNDNKWCKLQYDFFMKNLYLAAVATYTDCNHLPVYDYYVREGYDGLVRTYSSDNHERRLQGRVITQLRLFNRSLTLGGSVIATYQRNSGLINRKGAFVEAWFYAGWYYKNFSATVSYTSPSTTINEQQGFKTRTPQTYSLDCAYSIGDFRASFRFSNWFSQGYVRRDYDSPHYSFSGSSWSRDQSRGIALTLSYTFAYGKKIERDDEFDASRNPAM